MSAQCQQKQWKEKPLVPPQAGRKKGWMNLKQTSERLAVSQTAQRRNQLQRACWTDSRTGTVTTSCVPCEQINVGINNFYNCVCTHSRKASLIGFLCAYMLCTVCVCLWMIELATQTLSNATFQILPTHSLWNRSACLIQRKIEEVECDPRLWNTQTLLNLIQLWNVHLMRKLFLVLMGHHGTNDDLLKCPLTRRNREESL